MSHLTRDMQIAIVKLASGEDKDEEQIEFQKIKILQAKGIFLQKDMNQQTIIQIVCEHEKDLEYIFYKKQYEDCQYDEIKR